MLTTALATSAPAPPNASRPIAPLPPNGPPLPKSAKEVLDATVDGPPKLAETVSSTKAEVAP